MKAAVLTSKNNLIQSKEVKDPIPAAGEVLIDLKAASLNHRDVFIRQGLYAKIEYPCILGSDGAGVVSEIGEGVNGTLLEKEVVIFPGLNWGEGERVQSREFKVLGMPEQGTFAEKIVVPATHVFPKPAHLDFVEAAALPLAGLTGYRALFTRARLQPEEKVFITGIGGGVAQIVMHFALALKAEVWVSSGSDAKIATAMEAGAAGAVNYRNEVWAKKLKQSAGPFDVIIDSAGGDGFADLIEVAAPGGRIALYGGTLGKMNGISPQRIFWKQLDILGSTMGTSLEFARMLDFVEIHKLVPEVDMVYSLGEIEEAFMRMEKQEQMGKIVLEMEG